MADNTTHSDAYEISDESGLLEIGVSKAEGVAYGAALKYLTKMEASDSGEMNAGDYTVPYSLEDAEGLYHIRNGRLEWHKPREENCHVEIVVRNAAMDGSFPWLVVQATFTDANGTTIGSHEMPFLWHPWVYHHGRNRVVPHNGRYSMKVHIDAPTFPRHDRKNGRQFASPVDVDFEVTIKTGRKLSRDKKAA